MKSAILWTGFGLATAVGLWTAVSLYLVRNIEEAPYSVLESVGDIEVRRYPALLVAETALGDGDEGQAFGRLARYIFGSNRQNAKIAMTAPVIVDGKPKSGGTSIAMTAPVLVGAGDARERTMAFVLPRALTIATAPIPNDTSVNVRETAPRVVAALRFSGFATTGARQRKTEELLQAVKAAGMTAKGVPTYAGYNPPWSMPLLQRHEMLVEVDNYGG